MRYETIETGGRCQALVIDGPLGRVMVTDESGCSVPGPGEAILVGVYHAEHDELPMLSLRFESLEAFEDTAQAEVWVGNADDPNDHAWVVGAVLAQIEDLSPQRRRAVLAEAIKCCG